MSLIVALLNNAANADAARAHDAWARLGGEAGKSAKRGPSPFRAAPQGRTKHLFGAH